MNFGFLLVGVSSAAALSLGSQKSAQHLVFKVHLPLSDPIVLVQKVSEHMDPP